MGGFFILIKKLLDYQFFEDKYNHMNLTNEQALNNLYAASRLATIPADQHDILRKCAEQLLEFIKANEAKAPTPAST